MQEIPAALPGSAGAAWRQQALKVVRRAPEAAHSQLPLGAAVLIPEHTFAQHGVLGDPDALVVSFAVRNEGHGVAPLADVAVSFAVRGVRFDAADDVAATWQDDSSSWTYGVGRIGDIAQFTLSRRGLLDAGAVTSAAFRVRMTPAANLGFQPLDVTATGYAEVPHRPAASTTLSLPVEPFAL